MTAQYIVRARSWTRPTWVKPGYGPNGWKQSVGWTPWHTVAKYDSPREAWTRINSEEFTRGLQRAAVFHRGKRLLPAALHRLCLELEEAAQTARCLICGETKRNPEEFSDGLRCTVCVDKEAELESR